MRRAPLARQEELSSLIISIISKCLPSFLPSLRLLRLVERLSIILDGLDDFVLLLLNRCCIEPFQGSISLLDFFPLFMILITHAQSLFEIVVSTSLCSLVNAWSVKSICTGSPLNAK